MAKQHDSARPKVSVQARVDADAVDRIDAMGKVLDWTRSELVDFGCRQVAAMTPEQVLGVVLKEAKAKGKGKDKG